MVTCGEFDENACKQQIFNRFSPESYETSVSGRSSDLFLFYRLPISDLLKQWQKW